MKRIYYLLATTYYGISLIEKVPEIKLVYITIPVNITYFFILLIPILFVSIVSISIAAFLFRSVWMIILLLVPHPVLFTYIHNIRVKEALEHLIRLPKYKGDIPLRKIDKLTKWMVCPVIIAYLEWLRFNELNTEKKYNFAILLGDFRGTDALIRAMKEEDINARLGVTDALEKLIKKHGDRVLKKVIKSADSKNPIVRLSVATILSNTRKNHPELIRNNPKAESALAKLRNDIDPKVQSVVVNRN